jgi:cell division protein FtsB
MENLLKIGSITDEESPLLQQQSLEYIKHRSKKTSSRDTKKSGLLSKRNLFCFKKHSRKKKKLSLEREIKVLEEEARYLTFVIMYGRRHITVLKKEHEHLQTRLQNDWHKNDAISVERNSLVRQVKNMREKRDWLSSTARSTEGEVEVLKAERNALKLEVEKLRGHCKEAAALREGLNTLTAHCDEPSEEPTHQRDDLISEAKNEAAYIEAMQKDKNALKLEAEQLRGQCKDAAILKEARGRLILETKRQAREMTATKDERDAPKLEVEQLRGQCKDATILKEDRGRLILETKRQAQEMKAVKEERDALKLEAERLRGQCKDAAALKEQLNIGTVQRHKLGRDRRTLVVIVIMLVLCIFVGLLWTLRDSVNTYGTPFTSLYKTLSSRNSILATAVPSRNIVV